MEICVLRTRESRALFGFQVWSSGPGSWRVLVQGNLESTVAETSKQLNPNTRWRHPFTMKADKKYLSKRCGIKPEIS